LSDSEGKQVKLSVYVDEDIRAKFKATCAMQKVSMNHVVNQLLEDWLIENGAIQEQPPTSDTSSGGKGRG
jgi:hypothetical protein